MNQWPRLTYRLGALYTILGVLACGPAGGVAALALFAAVLLPKAALPILLTTSGPAGLWTLVLAYFLWTFAPEKS